MIEELLLFYGIDFPSRTKKTKLLTEEEKLQFLKEEENLNLAQQVLRRKQQEQEEKRKKILKELRRVKKVNLEKFLTRTIGLEQKRNLDLEKKRLIKLEKETQICKEKPELSIKTIEICKTSYKKPIYKRTKDILEEREKKLKTLQSIDYNIPKKHKNKALNKSMDNINLFEDKKDFSLDKNKGYIINDKIKNKKMNIKYMNNYYLRNVDWLKKKEEKYKKLQFKKKREIELNNQIFFHPYINPTFENKYKDNDNSYENDFMKMNEGKSVFERLYEDTIISEIKKKDILNKTMSFFFQPYTNKNKYKLIKPKYNKTRIEKRDQKISRNSDKLGYCAKSAEIEKKSDFVFKKRTDLREPWENILLKLRKQKNNYDEKNKIYRLNIRQAMAWNENNLNNVPYKGQNKQIVTYFL